MNFWDHLHDGKQAYDSLQVMIRQSSFPNLMDTHPPGLFQIDGNLGAANGMLEALVQSRWMPAAAEIEFLPALPQQWTEGSVEGLRVRGGAAVDMRWKDGKVKSLKLHAAADGAVRLLLPAGQAIARVATAAGTRSFHGLRLSRSAEEGDFLSRHFSLIFHYCLTGSAA